MPATRRPILIPLETRSEIVPIRLPAQVEVQGRSGRSGFQPDIQPEGPKCSQRARSELRTRVVEHVCLLRNKDNRCIKKFPGGNATSLIRASELVVAVSKSPLGELAEHIQGQLYPLVCWHSNVPAWMGGGHPPCQQASSHF